MKQLPLPGSFFVTAIASVLATQPGLAQEKIVSESSISAIPQISETEQPLTESKWLTQASPSPEAGQEQIAQVTAVQLKPTDKGLEVILETAGEFPEVLTSSTENSLITDIPNAQLHLPKGGAFRQDNPSKDIASVEVTNLDAKTLRVIVTGNASIPTAEVSQSPQALILSVVAPPAPAPSAPPIQPPAAPPAAPESKPTPEPEPQAEEEKPVELTVTAEEEAGGYNVPDATTATRTDTPILDTPQSIQVVPQQVLEDQQIIRVDQALRNVSGIAGNLGAFGSATNLTIRGFTVDNFTGGPTLRDGFRVYDNLGEQETANIERIEVLKGPPSILYGQNDPGGIINLVTKQPLFEPFYKPELQVGSFGLVRPTLDISGPLNKDKTLRYRLNAAYQHEDGFRDFTTETDRYFIAPVLSWDISDRTTLSLLMEYMNETTPQDLGLVAFGDGVVDVPYSRIFNEPDDFRQNRSLTLGYNLKHQLSDNWTLQNGFRYVSQDYNVLTLLPFSFDETTGELTRFYADREYHSNDYSLQTNVVGKFATGPVEHTLLAGVDLNWNRFDEAFTRVDTIPVPLNVFNPVYGAVPRPDFSTVPQILPEFDTEYDRFGVFLQDQISLLDNFILVGSVRFDNVDFRNTGEGTSRNNSAWSPLVGVVYQPLETVSLYANYSESFVPSGDLDVSGNFLDPETAQGFEVGAKAKLLNGGLLATLAYFDITKQNVPTVVDPLTGASVATGGERSQGLELDVTGEILPGWNVIGFYGYTNARVTEDNVIPVGNRLYNAPRHSASLWTTYEIQRGTLQGLGFGLGVNYVGNRFGDLANSFEVGDYFLTNAALFYRRNGWRIGLNVNNLFNVKYISSTSDSRTFGITPGAPMSVVGSVSVEF